MINAQPRKEDILEIYAHIATYIMSTISNLSNKYQNKVKESMLSAKIVSYNYQLAVEDSPKPQIFKGEQVLIKIGATGLCHSDLHLINGDWKDSIPLNLPLIPGHEIAGWVEEIGTSVPGGLFEVGDIVAVFGGWGCGICLYCKTGDEQMCQSPKWAGIMQNGGFAEYLLVESYRFLVKVERHFGLEPEQIAPLTDAGLTPYRAIKKVKNILGPDKSIAINGIGGLGYYGIQYAKILGQSSTVIALDRNDGKLALAESVGADYVINTSDGEEKINAEIYSITEGRGFDVIVDCVGNEQTISRSINNLNKKGILVIVGLFGNQFRAPLVKSVINEYTITGSLWGNFNELSEVISLAKYKKIQNIIQKFKLSEINEAIDLLEEGKILGRVVIAP